MQYAIDTVEVRKTRDGDKEYKSVTLKTDKETFERVSIWPDFAGYEAVVEGGVVVGEVVKKGEYLNFKAEGAKPMVRGAGAITKAMEVKNTNIIAAQDRKHDAIAKAGAFRDATLISLAARAGMPFPTDEEFKEEWKKWVRWILTQHDEPFI